MKQSKGASRPKRGLMIINLIETPAGYSIIQGTQILNKPQNQTNTNNQVPQIQSTSNTTQPPVPIIKQPPKMTIKQNNLYFLKKPTVFAPKQNEQQKPLDKRISRQTRSYADWFNFNEVSQFEKNEIKFWVFEDSFENIQDNDPALLGWIQKYKKHRNIIIEIYYAHFAPNQSYMSASAVRRYICQDANWLMKIHVFLTSWGIINSSKINFDNQNLKTSSLFLLESSGKYGIINLKPRYHFSKDGEISEPNNYETLKKVTQSIRPYCDYCGIHCQMVWFQHIRVMDPKEISTIMKNVNSKNPPLSQKQYEIILCTKCFCNGNFPLLLTHHDFRKVTVNDRLEPGKRKKINKTKRKQKKKKNKQKQMLQQQQQYKQAGEQVDEDGFQKQKEQQQNENEQEKDEANKEKKANGTNMNGTKQIRNNIIIQNGIPANQPQKQPTINQVIQQIVSSIKKDRIWSHEQTLKILELIQNYDDDWETIYKSLRKAGYCTDCQPEDIIEYFIKMPLNNVSELIEQNNSQSFLNQNKNMFKSDFLTKKVQRNFDNLVKVSEQLKKKPLKNQTNADEEWKNNINKFIEIYTRKIMTKVDMLTELQAKSVAEQRKYEQATKEISNE